MICPKCGFEQPDSLECMRCGVIVSRYKGPVLGGAPASPVARVPELPPLPSQPPPPPVPQAASMGTVFGDPAPAAPAMAMAGGGTLYNGPMPAAGGTVFGETVYGGPGSAQPVPAARGRQVHGQFEIGKLLSESFSVYFSNFLPFVLLTGIALAPLYLVQAYMTAAPENVAGASAALSLVVLGMSAILCPYIATAAITYGVFQQMRGKDTSIGDCLGRGLSALFPVLLLAIVQGFAILLGVILCLIPGILWSLWWAVSVPAAIEERLGVFDAMSRSKILTEGYRGDIFGVLFVLGILNFGSTLVLAMAAAKNESLLLVLSGIKDLLTVGLSATATAVMYYRLRSVKESIDVDQISSVFA